MIYAWVNGVKRQPVSKGEITTCNGCGGELCAVISPSRIAHWRHKNGDCDSWSEPEGLWHLTWKSIFPTEWCEITINNGDGETHRADVLVPNTKARPLVLELQHSSITYDEIDIRERFYKANHRMFWLVHLHQDKKSNTRWNFEISVNTPLAIHNIKNHKFEVHEWLGRGNFLDRWIRSKAHVFLDVKGSIFYLANKAACKDLVSSLAPKQFAIARLSVAEFIKATGYTKPDSTPSSK